MASPHIIVIKQAADFEAQVLQASLPVLVFFTAQSALPCKSMFPIIDKIAKRSQGKLKVCNIDVEVSGGVYRKCLVSSLPTVAAFHNGQLLGQIEGFTSESLVLKLFDPEPSPEPSPSTGSAG